MAFQSTIDKQVILTLGRQIRPDHEYWLNNCLEKITEFESTPSKQYVFIDCSNLSRFKSLTVRSNIFDSLPWIWIVSDEKKNEVRITNK